MDEDTDQAQDTVTGESDGELSDEELNDLVGGDGSISFNFGHIETTYKPQ
jgi:hypothetical protein